MTSKALPDAAAVARGTSLVLTHGLTEEHAALILVGVVVDPQSLLETVKHERHGHVGVVCPLCHKAMTLSRAVHTVTDDGTVHPSLVCRQTGCLFHAFVRLDGW